jgi:predicted glycoside hydrolase/deacetylase ChbG (UPF0249 family)
MLEKAQRQNILLTADDFGKSKLANQNILKLAKAGKLSRVSLMSEGDFTAGEIEELVSCGVKLDLHLELDWQKKRRKKLKDNTLKQGIIFLANHIRAGQRKKTKENWKRQIEKFQEIVGRSPDGLNSHEYVHFFPTYFKIVLELAEYFKIPFVRFGKKGFQGRKTFVHLILNNLGRWDKKYFFASRLDSSDYFTSLDWIKNLNEFFKNLPEGKIEIACHPEREEEFELIAKYF